MNTKYILRNLAFLFLIAFTVSSCYKESDWLGDNTTTEGKHFPVIAGITILDEMDTYPVGTNIQIDLDFWSLDEISTIKLYQTIGGGETTEVKSYPFVSNFQEDSQTDELIMDYQIPSITEESVSIRLDVEVINVNGLTRNSVDSGTANRPSLTITAVK
ncbi:hypothetical protein [Portibacter lacus]|uniref:DUF1735 domain-containing protein n=1 Tax=Portibacter lacus TaxID=1099794 RepID=A0AA37SN34_9BACT|nr:hypothetical protein [Portibacter lacus]GLR15648.1 hypothetical protein GCM10007940_02630 [Portibacter lacus]